MKADYQQGVAANKVITTLQEFTPTFSHALGELAVAVRMFCVLGSKFGKETEEELQQQFLQILDSATATVGGLEEGGQPRINITVNPTRSGH